MNLKIVGIKDAGIASKERLVLKVLRDDDIGYYVVFDTTFLGDGKVSNKVKHSYWFPDKEVQAGDLVILYTKQGFMNEKKHKNGFISHFFYWGLEMTVWNKEGDCVVLLQVDDWVTKGAF